MARFLPKLKDREQGRWYSPKPIGIATNNYGSLNPTTFSFLGVCGGTGDRYVRDYAKEALEELE